MKPGKRIVNDDSLPKFLLEWFDNGYNNEDFKRWMKNYIQARFSGDGWIHLKKNWIGLTKAKSISLDNETLNELNKLYFKGRKIKDYPKEFIEKLKKEARKETHLPKELLELKDILHKVFYINSRVYSVGIRTIYYDRKRDRLIISGSYHLLISRRDNIKKFEESLNFLEIDKINRKKLNLILKVLIIRK